MAPRQPVAESGHSNLWSPKDITTSHVVINNKVYDISSFMHSHPGGLVICSYAGQDASDAFRAFHCGSQKSYDMLEKYYVGDLTQPMKQLNPFELDVRNLATKAMQRGLYKSSKLRYLLNFTVNASLVIVPAVMCFYSTSFFVKMMCAIVMALGFTQFGWTAHEYAHHQVFDSHFVNDMVLLFCCVFLGFDREWWSLKHNLHHAIPNVHESTNDAHDGDPDIDTLPFLAWSKRLARKVMKGSEDTAFARFCVKNQHVIYFPLLLFARMTWLFQSFAMVFRINTSWGAVAPDKSSGTSQQSNSSNNNSSQSIQQISNVQITDIKLRYETLERCVMLLHFGWYFGVLAFSMNISTAICFFFLNQMFTGFCMAVAFGVGHNGMAVFDADKKPGFYELQVLTTRNVVDTPLVGWFMGGLHYQIEHHLFPTMPRHSLRYIAPDVIELCKKHNLPYHRTGLVDGTLEVLSHLKAVAIELNQGPM